MHRNLILFFSIIICFVTSCEEGFDLNSGITLSEKNELYTLELNVSNNVTNDLSPVHFSANVIRHLNYQIRSDSRLIGYWSIYALTIDDVSENIAQFPTDYNIYPDQTFDKIDENTITGERLYSSGGWTADMTAGTVTTSLQGVTTIINISFDHDGPIIPLDGYMVWNFVKDGVEYEQILQKTEYTDPAQFTEPESYLSITSAGGTLEGLTVPSEFDIIIQLPNEVNTSYEVSGSFVPALGFYEGNILATLDSESYSIINVNIPISIEIIY
tara:strand:- start:969 stop:1781 length:813 start_codon:yes stop_codon:yes gene_type:complete